MVIPEVAKRKLYSCCFIVNDVRRLPTKKRQLNKEIVFLEITWWNTIVQYFLSKLPFRFLFLAFSVYIDSCLKVSTSCTTQSVMLVQKFAVCKDYLKIISVEIDTVFLWKFVCGFSLALSTKSSPKFSVIIKRY